MPRPDSKLAASAYFGRAPLLGSLERELASALAGQGRLVLLLGEAGIGKTRTADEIAARALDGGARLVRVHCPDDAGAPALWPWQCVLRELLANEPPERSAPPVQALLRTPRVDARSLEASAGERFQLFQAVTESLVEAAQRRPLVITLDDLHAADGASLRLLAHAAPELGRGRLLIIATLRGPELTARPLPPALLRHARVVRLEALDADAGASLAEGLSGSRPSFEVAAALHERSEGNPLFLRQIVELLVAEGCDLADPLEASRVRSAAPHGVEELIRDRLTRLPAPLRRALRIAALLGRDFDLELLAHVCAPPDIAEAELPDLLPARAAGLLGQRSERIGYAGFSHVLIRDVLARELAPDERRALHEAIAKAILARRDVDADDWLAAVAHHLLEAGPTRDAVRYAARAGARALARYSDDDAIRWFERALACVSSGAGLAEEREHARLLVGLGIAQWRTGLAQVARESFGAAVALARRAGDVETAAEAAIGLAGRTDATLGPEAEATVALEAALERLGTEPGRLRAELLARLATALYFGGDPAKCDRVSRAAVECAESLGDPSVLAYALTARHYVLYRPGTLAERWPVALRTLELALRGDDANTTALAHFNLILDALEAGSFEVVDEQVAALGAIAERLRQPFLLWQQAAFQATRKLVGGDFAEAETLAARARELGQQAESPNALALFSAQLYAIRRDQGRLGELEPLLARLGETMPRMPSFAFARAEARLARGDVAEARAFLRAAMESQGRLPHDLNWGAAASIAARVSVATGESGLAERLYEGLSPFAGTCFVLGVGNAWAGSVDLALGELALALERLELAESHLEDAVRIHARAGARPYLARTWLAQARLARLQGDTASVEARAGEALALARALGMEALAREAAPLVAGEHDRTASPEPRRERIERVDDGWRLAFEGQTVVVPDARGMTYLATLLERPCASVHVLDLLALHAPPEVPLPRAKDAGEVLDARARREVRARMHELEKELEEARADADVGRAARLQGGLDQLEASLIEAFGIGGRARRVGDPVERARKAVYNRIRDAIRRIESGHPALGRHLRSAIRTGRVCSYEPERPLRWAVGAPPP